MMSSRRGLMSGVDAGIEPGESVVLRTYRSLLRGEAANAGQ